MAALSARFYSDKYNYIRNLIPIKNACVKHSAFHFMRVTVFVNIPKILIV